MHSTTLKLFNDIQIVMVSFCHILNGNVVGHLPKGKYGRFSKTTFFFLRADEYGSCKVRINKSKAINRGDGMEIQSTLEFIGQRRFIDILKRNLKD